MDRAWPERGQSDANRQSVARTLLERDSVARTSPKHHQSFTRTLPVGGGRAPPPAPPHACGGREAAASRKEDLLANSEHIAEHQCIARAPERRQNAARACTERRQSPERRQSIARASLGASWDAFGGSALDGGLKRARARAPRNAFGVSWDLLRVSWELLGCLAILLRDLGRRWASLDTFDSQ